MRQVARAYLQPRVDQCLKLTCVWERLLLVLAGLHGCCMCCLAMQIALCSLLRAYSGKGAPPCTDLSPTSQRRHLCLPVQGAPASRRASEKVWSSKDFCA